MGDASGPRAPVGRRGGVRTAARTVAALAAAALVVAGAARGVAAWTIARAVDRLDSPDEILRDTSETRLRTLDDPAPVVGALSHERAAVRRRLVWIVAAHGERTTPALLACLADADPAVRVAACDALAPRGGEDVAAGLARAASDGDAGVRRAATAALAARADAPSGGDAAWRVAAARAVRWMWSRQDADGGWRGPAYGVFEDGRSLTPFVLETLLGVPAEIHAAPDGAVRRALDFVAANGPEGADFSTYATSLALRCVVRARPAGWEARAAAHVAWLRRAQFAEDVGCPPEDPAHGAWGLDAARPGLFARADLSATCFALRALADAGVPRDDPVMRRARVFVDRCRSAAGDGGYFLSTNSPQANKAGGCGELSFRSYGSATADGALARWLVTGATDAAGLRWLAANPEATRAPGFSEDLKEPWDFGVMFYYAAERSFLRDALRAADDRAARAWEDGFRRTLLARQRADGSWANECSLMREDEPLVATSFAVQTLVRLGRP